MAAPTYGHDLTTIDTCDATGAWTVPSDNTGGTPTADSEYFIQRTLGTGNGAVTQTSGNKTGIKSMIYGGTGYTLPTNGAFFLWQFWAAPNSISSQATGGMRIYIGNSASAFYSYYVGGTDQNPGILGGWINHVCNPNVATADATVGSPTGTWSYIGCAANCNNIVSKGNPHGVDVVRYGRGESRFAGGEEGDYATLDGFATLNDASTARWGLIQYNNGSYLVKGKVSFGNLAGASASVNFVDSNRIIFIQDVQKVSYDFNRFEVNSTGSIVSFSTFSITSLSSVSPGSWTNNANAEVTFDSCVFTDMADWRFGTNTTAIDTTWRRCNYVYQYGATFEGCTFDNPSGSVALVSDNPEAISYCDFTSSGSGSAIEITASGSYSFEGNTFNGYSDASGSVDAAIYNNSGGYVVLNVTNSVDVPTYWNGSGATTLIQSTVTHTVTDLDTGSRVVWIRQADGVELENKEESGGEAVYSYSYVSPTPVWVQILSIDKKVRIVSVTLGSTNQELPAAQEDDPFYYNPPP